MSSVNTCLTNLGNALLHIFFHCGNFSFLDGDRVIVWWMDKANATEGMGIVTLLPIVFMTNVNVRRRKLS